MPEAFQGGGGRKSSERGIQGSVAESRERGILLCSVISFFVISVQLKHHKFGALLPSQAKDGRGSHQIWPPVLHP